VFSENPFLASITAKASKAIIFSPEEIKSYSHKGEYEELTNYIKERLSKVRAGM